MRKVDQSSWVGVPWVSRMKRSTSIKAVPVSLAFRFEHYELICEPRRERRAKVSVGTLLFSNLVGFNKAYPARIHLSLMIASASRDAVSGEA